MIGTPLPRVRDPARLAALRRTVLLDSAAEEAFDRLTRLATKLLRVPVSLVSLVDEDRQFFKSCIGLPEPWATARETPMSHSFCQHAVNTAQPLIINDARVHPLVKENLAIPDLNVVAYAGIPLITPDGYPLGSFCAIDSQPRAWSEEEVAILQDLAAAAATEIALRLQTLEAQQAVAVRDELLSLVSHDLKSPVSVIRAYADLLNRRLPPRSPQDVDRIRSGLRQIETAADNLSAQIEELIDVAYVQAGEELRLDRQPTDLVALTQQAVADQQQTTRHHQIQLFLKAPELIGSYDAARIERMLTNLLANAIKYSPSGRQIDVEVVEEDDQDGMWAVIHVRDQGVGIPAADLPKIFQHFYRASNVGPISGTGIGLASARQIVEQHGGTITVASVEGQGTTFTVRLPLLARP